jgi:hypothetical protein
MMMMMKKKKFMHMGRCLREDDCDMKCMQRLADDNILALVVRETGDVYTADENT